VAAVAPTSDAARRRRPARARPELEQRVSALEEELKLALVETDPADRRT
jgi:hypothetical protein